MWRIARRAYGQDREGTGAFTHGGRWTPPGVRVLHGAGSIALAALEYLVHAPKPPPDLVLVAIDIPNDAPIDRPAMGDLPENWASPLPSGDCQAWGARWCSAAKSIAIAVPSVVVPEERNYVINVAHRSMREVRLKPIRRFAYDPRLLRR